MYNLKTETTYVLDYDELDDIIKENFPNLPKDFTCVADQEWNNDMSHTVNFEKEEMNTYDKEDVDAANNGEWNDFVLWSLMQDLVNRDILPEGDYRIDISW